MANINFYLRNPKEKKPQSIWAVFYNENVRFRIDTNQTIKPSDWSIDKKLAKTTYINSNTLNKLLKEQSKFIEDHIDTIKLKKQRFYKDVLEKQFNHHFKIGEAKPQTDDDVVDFISFIDMYLKQKKDITDGTLRVLKTTKRHLLFAFNLVPPQMKKEWEAMSKVEKTANPDFLVPNKLVDFDQVDSNWIKEFYDYLLRAEFYEKKTDTWKGYTMNFIAKQIKNVKQFCNEARKAKGKYIKNVDYDTFDESETEEADTIHLDWDEINKLKALDFDPMTTQGKVRNLFVLNCYLGLRYSDLKRLKNERFKTINNQLFLQIRAKKTKKLTHFPVLKSAEDVLRMYEYNLPSVCEKVFNEEIKLICQMAGICTLEEKRETRGGKSVIHTLPKYMMVSSHTGRRSFATNWYDDGVAIIELMAVTGHTTEGAFKRYVKRTGETKFTTFISIGANR